MQQQHLFVQQQLMQQQHQFVQQQPGQQFAQPM